MPIIPVSYCESGQTADYERREDFVDHYILFMFLHDLPSSSSAMLHSVEGPQQLAGQVSTACSSHTHSYEEVGAQWPLASSWLHYRSPTRQSMTPYSRYGEA